MSDKAKKKSKDKYGYFYFPIELDPEFPIFVQNYSLRDDPIVRLQSHNVFEMGYCHEGSGIFIVGSKIMQFNSNDFIVINENEHHYAQSTQGTKSRWTFFFFDPLRLLSNYREHVDILDLNALQGPDFQNLMTPETHPDICQLADQLCKEANDMKPHYREGMKAILYSIFVKLHRLKPIAGTTSSKTMVRIALRLNPAIQYIGTHYSRKIEIKTLADLCFTTQRNFNRMFMQAYDRTPLQYISDLRISVSCTLLRNSDQSISSISMQCGFASLSSFNRQFLHLMGVSPRKWRKQEAREIS